MNSYGYKTKKHLADPQQQQDVVEEVTISYFKDEGYIQEVQKSSNAFKKIDLHELKKKYEKSAGLGRRIAPRFSVQVSAVVFTPTYSFRTKTLNISASGALLEDLLPPEFMLSKIEILLVYTEARTGERHRLLFRGKPVGGPLRTARIQFEDSAKHALETLQNLFAELTPLPA